MIAPDHPGNTLADIAQLGNEQAQAQSAIDRPLDVSFVLDKAMALVASADARHSFAGTALEVARREMRVDVVFPMAPGFRNGSTDELVAMLARPLLMIGGSLDDTCEFPSVLVG